jgi:hypothetical protein
MSLQHVSTKANTGHVTSMSLVLSEQVAYRKPKHIARPMNLFSTAHILPGPETRNLLQVDGFANRELDTDGVV